MVGIIKMSRSKQKIIPLIVILRDNNWGINISLYTARNQACQCIQVHGTNMDQNLCQEMFDDLIGTIEKVKNSCHDPLVYQDVENIEKQVKRLAKLD